MVVLLLLTTFYCWAWQAQKMLGGENERTKAALTKVAELEGDGAAGSVDTKEKEELLQLQACHGHVMVMCNGV